LVPVYTAQISYERKEYLVNANNEKIGIISMDSPIGSPAPSITDVRYGNIYLPAEQVSILFTQTPATGKVIGEVIADMADSLIHADLITRGILSA
jgi:hypothetical protein